MGKIEQVVGFTGSVGNLTAYRMRGVDGIVVRQKGGVSKERIQTDLNFGRTRENNAEFGGRSAASKSIMAALIPLKPLADHNIAGPLNALLRPIQVADPIGKRGQRSVELSKSPALLEGFSLNNKTSFESIVRAPLAATVSRETMSAEIVIPELVPDINFKPQGKHPLYRLEAALGLVPDFFYSPARYNPSHPNYIPLKCVMATTEWLPSKSRSEATTLGLKLDFTPPDGHFTLMLSIGIWFGYPVTSNQVQQVEYAGAAKVLRAV
jgi:hypothetical protein